MFTLEENQEMHSNRHRWRQEHLLRGISAQIHRATCAVHAGQQVPHAFDEGREAQGE